MQCLVWICMCMYVCGQGNAFLLEGGKSVWFVMVCYVCMYVSLLLHIGFFPWCVDSIISPFFSTRWWRMWVWLGVVGCGGCGGRGGQGFRHWRFGRISSCIFFQRRTVGSKSGLVDVRAWLLTRMWTKGGRWFTYGGCRISLQLLERNATATCAIEDGRVSVCLYSLRAGFENCNVT